MNIDAHHMLKLEVDDVLGHMVAVLGMTGSGKSNTVAVLAEELLSQSIPVCVVDTAGEYYGLKEQFDIWEIGRARDTQRRVDAEINPTNAYHAAKTAYTNAASVILNVSGFVTEARDLFIASFMETIWDIAPHHRHPYVIILEEAHNYIPQRGRAATSEGRSSLFAPSQPPRRFIRLLRSGATHPRPGQRRRSPTENRRSPGTAWPRNATSPYSFTPHTPLWP